MADAALRRDWIAPGMDLIVEGDAGGPLYVLKEGELEVLRNGRHVTTIRTPGAVIGEMSVLLERPHTATVRALTPVDVFVIDDALAVLKAHPDWLLQIARLLARRVDVTTAALTEAPPADAPLVLPGALLTSWTDPAL